MALARQRLSSTPLRLTKSATIGVMLMNLRRPAASEAEMFGQRSQPLTMPTAAAVSADTGFYSADRPYLVIFSERFRA